jgi:very-short-patch-repair endonuclease
MRSANDQILSKRASKMRREPTEPEKRLWRSLSNSQLAGYKFRRQAIIENRICDFFCPQKNLVIEVDGDTHTIAVDMRRDAVLADSGVSVLHVRNEDVMTNIGGVLEFILNILEQQPDRWPHPNPSPKGEGLA